MRHSAAKAESTTKPLDIRLAAWDRHMAADEVDEADAILGELLANLDPCCADTDWISIQARHAMRIYRGGRFEAARELADEVLERSNGNVLATTVRALALKGEGRLPEACATLRSLVQRDPTSIRTRMLLADTLCALGDERAVEETLRAAAAQFEKYPALETGLGSCLLRQGRWSEAWPHWERRFEAARLIPSKLLSCPGTNAPLIRWTVGPQPAALSVIAEQGVGDTITFASLLLRLDLTGQKVRFYTSPSVVPALSGLDPRIETLPVSEVRPARDNEHWAPLLGLPELLGLDLATYTQSDAYITKPSRPRRQPGPLKVGLIWQANPKYPARSLPLEVLAPLARLEHLELVALQHGCGAEQAEECSFRERLSRELLVHVARTDFLNCGRFLGEIDLLVGVDTSLVHLAGAMGIPACVLLQRHGADWRWAPSAGRAIWYPDMRLFRQHVPGDWAGAVTDLIIHLSKEKGDCGGPAVRREYSTQTLKEVCDA